MWLPSGSNVLTEMFNFTNAQVFVGLLQNSYSNIFTFVIQIASNLQIRVMLQIFHPKFDETSSFSNARKFKSVPLRKF